MYNMKYIIMATVALHNVCIHFNDPCESKLKLTVEELDLI